jgi:hypothetical protein
MPLDPRRKQTGPGKSDGEPQGQFSGARDVQRKTARAEGVSIGKVISSLARKGLRPEEIYDSHRDFPDIRID